MELRERTQKASKQDLDIISSMPDNVVTNILDRLPLQYVMRTSILSKNWRFKWIMLTQLVFDENFYKYLSRKRQGSDTYWSIISMFLLHHKGHITKFVLYIDSSFSVPVQYISHWLLFLNQKGIKDLTLDKRNATPLKLSSHLFSCLELKHLKLDSCWLDPPAGFHGFQNLLSLELCSVHFESGKFGELFTPCPRLEILNLGCHVITSGSYFPQGKVKLVEIAKLVNLKMLSLSLCNLDNMMITSANFAPMGFLPKLQELHMDFHECKFAEDGAKMKLPNIPHLKTLKLSTINLGHASTLSCTFQMIRKFRLVETLEITSTNWGAVLTPANSSLEVDYDIMGMLQLRSVVFTYCKGSENEVCLIKYLLACSPYIKKLVIRSSSRLPVDEKFEFSRKLLKLHRASSVVDIDLS